jgi:hypothetical protein
MEKSAMASMMALPHQGGFKAVFQMFAFLKSKHNGKMVFDPTVLTIDETKFPNKDWSATVYGTCLEELPPNTPRPCVLLLIQTMLVTVSPAGHVQALSFY